MELENLMPTDKLFLLIISDAAAALVVVAVIVVVAAVVIAVAAAASKETSMRISGSDKLTFCSKSMKKVKLGRIFDVSVQKDLSFSQRNRSWIRSFLTCSQQPCHFGNTSSHSNTEAQQHWARPVLERQMIRNS